MPSNDKNNNDPKNSNDQIFPDYIDPSKLKYVSPGHWEDEATGYVFATGTDFRPPAAETAPPEIVPTETAPPIPEN